MTSGDSPERDPAAGGGDPAFEETLRDPAGHGRALSLQFLVLLATAVAVTAISYQFLYRTLVSIFGPGEASGVLFALLSVRMFGVIPLFVPLGLAALVLAGSVVLYGYRAARSRWYYDAVRVVDDAIYVEYGPLPFALRYGDRRADGASLTEIPVDRIEDHRIRPLSAVVPSIDDPGTVGMTWVREALPDLLVPSRATLNGRAAAVRDAEGGDDRELSAVELDLPDDRVRLVTGRPEELVEAIEAARPSSGFGAGGSTARDEREGWTGGQEPDGTTAEGGSGDAGAQVDGERSRETEPER